jgi:thiamine pyrophosphate-dependent acetolactate synthase large subunit-like protein
MLAAMSGQEERRTNEPQGIERPLPSEGRGHWGSDVIAELLRALDIPYVALNPGSSYRGLHDSLVNHLGNERPQMLLCLHEESAIALAHGWTKVTGRPMAAIVHSNVGLMHGSMAVFNAYADRAPLLLLGATGPVDTAKRRPWIDWLHTAKDQGALIRHYSKWDDQPASIPAAIEAVLRAYQIAATPPCGPTYICLDAGLQEAPIEAMPPLPDPARFRPATPAMPTADTVEAIARKLHAAERPLILMGRVGRGENEWQARIALAEAIGAVVLTDMKLGGTFPTAHRLYGAPATSMLGAQGAAVLREADAVLSLDWIDLGGTLKTAWGDGPIGATVMHISRDQQLHNGWNMDYQGLPPADFYVMADADPTVDALLAAVHRLGPRERDAWPGRKPYQPTPLPKGKADAGITVAMLARAMQDCVAGRDACLIRAPLSWAGQLWPVAHPLDVLGGDGGAGIGSGPGMAVGAALALGDAGGGRLPLAILGDGDFLMGVTALWTGVHYRVPLLVIIANNRSFYNDELHQERMAKQRGRQVANKWIGQHIGGPDIDLAGLARAQGAAGFGPVRHWGELAPVLADARRAVEAGALAVVDVRVEPGYEAAAAASMVKQD